ncbi:FliI/YscN family ATPase [Sedimentimonas flavescens]|uniref:FliI/YscN family ATPase n=1 Tax=Sedimentimonas flavescens TaxID=2851012 RepID=A0ABT2ZYN2_9RHOB|nr:FliI/YscN family ATPase [Sedimentimonas flavescens]MCV2878858.1 FliI/YscN family ATPase [Sedimentimonas flavescens]
MAFIGFEPLQAEISDIVVARPVGRVCEVGRGMIEVSGLAAYAALGDRARIWCQGRVVGAEVLALRPQVVTLLADGGAEGLAIGDRVELMGQAGLAPDDSWVGRIVDPFGRPLDGRPLARGKHERALRAPPPPAAQRRRLGARLETGLAVFNTLLPLVRGQRVGLFAGSGVGKSSLLGKLARGVRADVVVIALVGERGRELREFVEGVLGPEGMARSVVVAATSDQSPLVRRRCAWSAMAVAEHFRDQGQHVLFLADSVTRFAEAHREVALAGGEPPSLRGFPPSTSHQIMALAERAGPGPEGTGDITAIFSVLVAGSDMDEPVADILRGVLDGHVVLDRAIAERGRFPAIDLLRSVSRSLPDAASAEENDMIGTARRFLGAYDRAEMMVQAGLYAQGSDALVDRAIALWPALDGFISQDESADIQASFRTLAGILTQR